MNVCPVCGEQVPDLVEHMTIEFIEMVNGPGLYVALVDYTDEDDSTEWAVAYRAR